MKPFSSEGSGENIFLIRDEVIYTPSIDSSILSGITRDSIIKIAKKLNYKVKEMKIPREFIYLSGEIFFTGTAAEVTPVRTVDGITIGSGKRGPITEKIQSTFFDMVHGKIEDEFNWLTYID